YYVFCLSSVFFIIIRLSPRSTLFPYTTLFRSFKDLEYLENKISSYKSLFIEFCQKNKHSFHFENCEDKGKDAIKHFYIKLYFNEDRKSTRLNSSHVKISYAVFCLKKKKKKK